MAIPQVPLNVGPRGYAGSIVGNLRTPQGPSQLQTPDVYTPGGGQSPIYNLLQEQARMRNAMAQKQLELMQEDLNRSRRKPHTPGPLVPQEYTQGGRGYDPRAEATMAAKAHARLNPQQAARAGPFAAQDLGGWLNYIGPQAAHEGLMQTGRLLSSQGSGGVITGPMPGPTPTGASGRPGTRGWERPSRSVRPSLAGARRAYGSRGTGAGSYSLGSRERGTLPGTVPETGPYKLHAGEVVLEADQVDEPLLAALMEDKLGKTATGEIQPKGKKTEGYQAGSLSLPPGLGQIPADDPMGAVESARRMLAMQGDMDATTRQALERYLSRAGIPPQRALVPYEGLAQHVGGSTGPIGPFEMRAGTELVPSPGGMLKRVAKNTDDVAMMLARETGVSKSALRKMPKKALIALAAVAGIGMLAAGVGGGEDIPGMPQRGAEPPEPELPPEEFVGPPSPAQGISTPQGTMLSRYLAGLGELQPRGFGAREPEGQGAGEFVRDIFGAEPQPTAEDADRILGISREGGKVTLPPAEPLPMARDTRPEDLAGVFDEHKKAQAERDLEVMLARVAEGDLGSKVNPLTLRGDPNTPLKGVSKHDPTKSEEEQYFNPESAAWRAAEHERFMATSNRTKAERIQDYLATAGGEMDPQQARALEQQAKFHERQADTITARAERRKEQVASKREAIQKSWVAYQQAAVKASLDDNRANQDALRDQHEKLQEERFDLQREIAAPDTPDDTKHGYAVALADILAKMEPGGKSAVEYYRILADTYDFRPRM